MHAPTKPYLATLATPPPEERREAAKATRVEARTSASIDARHHAAARATYAPNEGEAVRAVESAMVALRLLGATRARWGRSGDLSGAWRTRARRPAGPGAKAAVAGAQSPARIADATRVEVRIVARVAWLFSD